MSRTHKDRNNGYWSVRKGIPSWFKKMQKKGRKAKSKAAVRDGREPDRERTSDHWDYW